MPTTTVLSEDGAAAIVSEGNDNNGFFRNRFSWSAAFAGTFVATATTFFLLALGAGFGLALVHPQTVTTPSFLTLGAIYFLAAQAFGFAAGGHIAGRLIGPAIETRQEEDFRSGAHGLVVWALGVVATATLIAVIGGIATGNSAISVAASSSKFDRDQSSVLTTSYVGYWVDMLFRPGPNPSQASLGGVQFAQVDNGTGNDATQAPPPPSTQPMQSVPAPETDGTAQPSGVAPSSEPTPSRPAVTTLSNGAPESNSIRNPREITIPSAPAANFTPPPSINSDKAEVSRIITVGMLNGAHLSQYDKDRIAGLVAQDTGLGTPEAQHRVDNAETRILSDEVHAADLARKTASYASLWIAIALFFGAIVSTMAAVSARWEDDAQTFGFLRREPE